MIVEINLFLYIWSFELYLFISCMSISLGLIDTNMLGIVYVIQHINGLVQERRNSRALAMELRLFCINPSKWDLFWVLNSYHDEHALQFVKKIQR